MSFQPGQPHPDDLRATLAIGTTEARTGTRRTLNLPDGRQITVSVPAGVQRGQVIRLDGQGIAANAGGPRGALILTIDVLPEAPPPSTGEENRRTVLSQSASSQPAILPPPPGTPAYPPQAATVHTPGPGSGFGYNQPTISTLPPPPPRGSATHEHTKAAQRNRRLLLISLALIVLLAGGAGLFLIVQSQNTASDQAQQTAVSSTATAATINARVRATSVQATSIASTATASVQATATTIASHPDPYPPGGTLALYESLTTPENGIGWETGAHCAFSAGSYHVISQDPRFFESCSNGINYSNFAMEVDMQIIHGNAGGVLFRGDRNQDQFYLFQINTDGIYSLFTYVDNNLSHVKTLAHSISLQFHLGIGQKNTLGVVAQNHTLSIYINRQQIIQVSDRTYNQGETALLAIPATTSGEATEVAYTNLKVWTF